MAKFNGFESSPAWTPEFFKITKFEPFGVATEFFKITKFEPFGVPKWLNLTVLNPPLPEPLKFLKITKFEPFGVPKWLNLAVLNPPLPEPRNFQNHQIWAIWGAKVAKLNGFESSPAWTPEFFKITKFEPCGVRKWLNLTVLNPPLPELLNFSKSSNLSHLACQSG